MNPHVELKSDTSNALQAMVFAARVCYGKENEHVDLSGQVKLIEKILKARHFSILEHCVLTFYITGVSRNFTHQLVRHRHMSFAQQSLHYTITNDATIAIGSTVAKPHADLMQTYARRAYDVYKVLIDKGVPREEARHILPSGIATKIVCTANLREWVHFVSIRSCAVNCEEIREVANQVNCLLTSAFPWLVNYLGPTCLTEVKCYEGAKSCGKPWQRTSNADC